MADIFDVVADSTRRELLQALLAASVTAGSDAGELSVGELVDKLSLSQPTVSKHLKVLRDHELVTVREEGQHRYYRIAPTPLEEIDDWLVPFVGVDYALDSTNTSHAAWAAGAEVGSSIGRVVAEGSHQVREVLHGASEVIHGATETVGKIIPKQLAKRWRDRTDDGPQ